MNATDYADLINAVGILAVLIIVCGTYLLATRNR